MNQAQHHDASVEAELLIRVRDTVKILKNNYLNYNILSHMKLQIFKIVTFTFFLCFCYALCGCEDPPKGVNGTYTNSEVLIIDSVLSEDETWYPDKVYHVEGILEIPPSVILEILPGTTVKFGRDALVKVRGTLKIGTPISDVGLEERVTLTSDKSNPGSGDWLGILYDHTHDVDSFVRGAVIEYADIALDIKTASPTVVDCILRNNATAIALNGSDSKIRHNTILDNRIGISTIERQNRPRIEYNRILNNDTGILCENVQSIIEYNNFEDNNYALKLNVKFNLRVPNNWWGTIASDAIQHKIIDSSDTDIITKQLGTVDFFPIAEMPIADAGPRE